MLQVKNELTFHLNENHPHVPACSRQARPKPLTIASDADERGYKLLDTSNMVPGVYFVLVNDGNAISEIKKLIVVR